MGDEMTVLEAISTRASVRRFTAEPITPEQLRLLLDAAFCAPSACNKRPWELIVVTDRGLLDFFAGKLRYQGMLREAPLAIVVCGNERRMPNHDLLVCDCAAAAENVLLAAHAIGLGACWCGLALKTIQRHVRERLELPEHIYPVATVAIGRPAEGREQPDRYNERRVHYDRFGSAGAEEPQPPQDGDNDETDQ